MLKIMKTCEACGRDYGRGATCPRCGFNNGRGEEPRALQTPEAECMQEMGFRVFRPAGDHRVGGAYRMWCEDERAPGVTRKW